MNDGDDDFAVLKGMLFEASLIGNRIGALLNREGAGPSPATTIAFLQLAVVGARITGIPSERLVEILRMLVEDAVFEIAPPPTSEGSPS